MKNKILLMAFLVLLMLSCERKVEITASSDAANNDKIKSEIQALENTYAAALTAGDADGVAAYYAVDAISYPQNEKPLVGKQAIRDNTAKEINESPKGMLVTFTTNEIHLSADGNQVVEIGAYKVRDSTNTTKITGNFMSVFVKKDGKYLCIRDMASSDTPDK